VALIPVKTIIIIIIMVITTTMMTKSMKIIDVEDFDDVGMFQ
jgi:hypothetical protein